MVVKKGRKAAKDAKKDSQKAFRPPQVGSAANHVELRFTNALLQISRGCYYLLVALEKGGFTPKYDSEFMPLRRRFERRFQPFHALTRPPCLPLSTSSITCVSSRPLATRTYYKRRRSTSRRRRCSSTRR